MLFNLSYPEQSVILMAPLAQTAGGYESCGQAIFNSNADSDYQTILAMIQEAKTELESMTRFNMPNFQPAPEYISEMKRYGILPQSHVYGDPVDAYKTDSLYFDSFYPKQASVGTGIVRRR
jgi:hypothetical protein